SRAAPRSVQDLLPARDSGGHDIGSLRRRPHRGEETLLADAERELVVFLLVPEGAGHAAATGVDLSDFDAVEHAEEAQTGSGPDQALLVAVSVEVDFPRHALGPGTPPVRLRSRRQVLFQ